MPLAFVSRRTASPSSIRVSQFSSYRSRIAWEAKATPPSTVKKILSLEHHVARAVPVRRLQGIANMPLRRQAHDGGAHKIWREGLCARGDGELRKCRDERDG
jgi:hypothetical protein